MDKLKRFLLSTPLRVLLLGCSFLFGNSFAAGSPAQEKPGAAAPSVQSPSAQPGETPRQADSSTRKEEADPAGTVKDPKAAPPPEASIDQATGSLANVLYFFFVLGFVCVLAWVVLKWWLPRTYGTAKKGAGHIQVVESFRMDARRQLVLVRVGDEYFLLSSSENGIRFLTRVDHDFSAHAPEAPPPGERRRASAFEILLRKKS